MKVIIAGSRTLTDLMWVQQAITEAGFHITEVVSGGCNGVDRNGELWAKYHNIPVKRFPADWKQHGRAAGPIRNAAMAVYADALIAVFDGSSRGTANMIREATARGLKIHIHLCEKESKPCA